MIRPKHIEQTIATDWQAGWVFVVDNLNTHCGEPLVRVIAERPCGKPTLARSAKLSRRR